MIIKDCRGVVLTVGMYVAYNQSGNVVPGEIIKIIPRWKKVTWHPGTQWIGSFRIRNRITNVVSIVKRPESIMAV